MAEAVSNGTPAPNGDVEMKEEDTAPPDVLNGPLDQQPPMMASEGVAAAQTPLPAAVATPPAASSASATRPGSMPPQPSAKPDKPVAHGGPTRQYLNQYITPHLLEGMKYIAAYEPEKPLLWLSEFLKERSKEVEG
jgi:COMPASS component SDC1